MPHHSGPDVPGRTGVSLGQADPSDLLKRELRYRATWKKLSVAERGITKETLLPVAEGHYLGKRTVFTDPRPDRNRENPFLACATGALRLSYGI